MKALSLYQVKKSTEMDIQAEKLSIIQWLTGIDDKAVIKQLKAFKQSKEKADITEAQTLSQAETEELDRRKERHLKGLSASFTPQQIRARLEGRS